MVRGMWFVRCAVDCLVVCFLKQKTAYEIRISDWSSDVCSSDLGRVTMAQARAAVAAVAPAMEVIDSRYENFKFALADVIADNSSSSGFVVGSWNDPHQDISNLGVILEIDGEVDRKRGV